MAVAARDRARRPGSAIPAGRPTAASPRQNAHPHSDTADRVHVVVNGIVENYVELKRRLVDMGAVFTSRDRRRGDRAPDRPPRRTGDLRRGGPRRVRRAPRPLRVRGDERRRPGRARRARASECPLIVGRGDGEQFIALGDPGVPARDPPASSTSRTTSSSSLRARRRRVPDGRRRAGDARGRGDRLGRGDGREAGLRDVHAQGDPRAGRRGRRDDRRARGARRRDRPRRRWARDRRRAAAPGSGGS